MIERSTRALLLQATAASLALVLCGGCTEFRSSAPEVTALTHATHTDFPVNTGAHAQADCNSCHGDFDTFKQFSCVTCHEHSQELTDPTHVNVANYSWSGTKCYECHPDGQASTVDHTQYFPIGQGSTHDNISCASCHPDRTNRKVTDCISCHTHAATETHAIHNGLPNYAYTSPKCLECHPQSTIPGIDHTAFFPVHMGATHSGISCRQCHPDRTNRQVLDCLTCHTPTATDPRHSTVGGYARTSPLCVRCHAESQVNLVSLHLPFSIRLGTKHYRTSCLTCHPSSRTDKPWAQDFVPFDCLSCHPKTKMDDTHQGRSGYAYVSTTCVTSGCHDDGRKP
jgi:hypothetical protein